ncbi:hypothetical protein INR49_031435 [Caranx melampygus]|nr:hypothetical protein INR49_031435 [Caranx melampygus]
MSSGHWRWCRGRSSTSFRPQSPRPARCCGVALLGDTGHCPLATAHRPPEPAGSVSGPKTNPGPTHAGVSRGHAECLSDVKLEDHRSCQSHQDHAPNATTTTQSARSLEVTDRQPITELHVLIDEVTMSELYVTS